MAGAAPNPKFSYAFPSKVREHRHRQMTHIQKVNVPESVKAEITAGTNRRQSKAALLPIQEI